VTRSEAVAQRKRWPCNWIATDPLPQARDRATPDSPGRQDPSLTGRWHEPVKTKRPGSAREPGLESGW